MLNILQQKDAGLVRKTLRGRREAFNTLVERHQELVFAVAYGIVANAADAEDVAQDAFLTAFHKLPTLREPAKFRAWLLTIARNRASETLIRRRREQPLDENEIPAPPETDRVADAELRELLRDRIERLPIEAREVLLLHYYTGLKVREIATELEISPEAAKKRLQRARDLLSARMLSQLRDTVEEQGSSSARTKSIITTIAGASAAWYGTTAAAAGTGLLGTGVALKIAGAVVVSSGIVGGILLLAEDEKAGGPESIVSVATNETGASEPVGATPDADAESTESRAAADGQENTDDDGVAGAQVIQGSVLDETGAPRADVLVTADPGGMRHSDHHETRTDADGHYEFEGLTNGFYLLQAFAEGAFGAAEASTQPPTAIEPEDIVLLPATDLHGVVTDAAGEALAGVTVTPVKVPVNGTPEPILPKWRQLRQVQTDGQGRFTIHHAWPGNWTLEFDSAAYVFRHLDGMEPGASPHTVTLKPGVSVRGRVVYRGSDDPLAGQEIAFGSQRKTTTGSDGTFALTGVQPGGWTPTFPTNRDLVVTSPPVALQAGRETSDLRVEVAIGGKIRGQITDGETGKPVRDARVEFRASAADMRGKDALTDNEGKFEIGQLLPGQYSVTSVQGFQHLALRIDDPDAIEVDFGTTVDGVDFELSPGVRVSGTVNFPEDESRENISVNAEYENEHGGTSSKGSSFLEDGRFSIRGLPRSGSVTLQLQGPGWTSNTVGPVALSNGDVSGIALTAQRVNVGSISGQVMQGRNPSESGETVWLHAEPDGDARTTAKADEQGAFRFDAVSPGAYSLRIPGPGREPTNVTVRPGQHVDDVVINLAAGDREIAGRVLDWHGEPVAGARISAQGSRAYMPDVTSDEKGNYSISGLGDGVLSIWVRAEGYGQEKQEGVVPGTRGVDFSLDPNGRAEGTVLDARTGKPIPEFEIRTVASTDPSSIMWALGTADEHPRQTSLDGAFRVVDIAPVEQAIVARADGYFGGYTVADIPPADTAVGLTIKLDPAPALLAKVLTADGAPVTDAKLFLNNAPHTFDNESFNQQTPRTDNDGFAPLKNFRPGVNDVYIYHPRKGRGHFEFDTNREDGEIPFVLPPTGTLEGTVTVAGQPIEDGRLSVEFAAETGPRHFRTMRPEGRSNVEPDGSFSIGSLIAGDAVLSIEAKGLRHMRPVYVDAEETSVLNIDLTPGSGVIELPLIVSPELAEARFMATATIEAEDGEYMLHSGVGDDGAIRFQGVPGGTGTILVATMREPGILLGRCIELEILPGKTVSQSVDFTTGVTVSGTVTSPSDIREIYVMLISGDVNPELFSDDGFASLQSRVTHQTVLSGDRSFRFHSVAPGTYTLFVGTEGFRQVASQVIVVGGEDVETSLALP